MDFDFEKEWEEFQKELPKESSAIYNLKELKEKLMDKFMDSYLMERIHKDYYDILKENERIEELKKENEELKEFIDILLLQTVITDQELPISFPFDILKMFVFNIMSNDINKKVILREDSIAYKILKEKENKKST